MVEASNLARWAALGILGVLVSGSGATAQNWNCIEGVSVGIAKETGKWRVSRNGLERWTVKRNGGQVSVTNVSQETIRMRDPELAERWAYHCTAGASIVCEGGPGNRFEFNVTNLRFVSFSRGIPYLIGANKEGAPGPSVAIGACAPF